MRIEIKHHLVTAIVQPNHHSRSIAKPIDRDIFLSVHSATTCSLKIIVTSNTLNLFSLPASPMVPSRFASVAGLLILLCPAAPFVVPDGPGLQPQRPIIVSDDFLKTTGSWIDHTKQQQPAEVSAPLYVSIGPPCAGKTTLLKQITVQAPAGQEALVDICLDDQPNVYVNIPISLFLLSSSEMESPELPFDHQYLLKRTYYQRTVQERILAEDHQELRLVLQRLAGKLSKEEFENALWSFHSSTLNDRNAIVLRTLLESIDNVMNNQAVLIELPQTVNLFIVEALFERDPTLPDCEWTGIERALDLLWKTPSNVPVSWGNTNTKPEDYGAALEFAQGQKRPVYFCVWGENNNMMGGESLFDLPKLEFPQLMDRNLQRLLDTGKYIPCQVIDGLSTRSDQLVADAILNFEGGIPPTKLDLDRHLAWSASFDLLDDRTVRKQQHEPIHPMHDLPFDGSHVEGQSEFDQCQTQQHSNFPSNDPHIALDHGEFIPSDFAHGNLYSYGAETKWDHNRFQQTTTDTSDNPLNFQGRD